MLRTLFALSLLAATAGMAHADPAPEDSVAVKIAGLTPNAAEAALRVAARQVCQTVTNDEVNAPIDCYNTTLRIALDELHRAERAPVPRGTQTASR
ncbi:hypothetical protein [Caulobacter sp. S45]|jgi:hypothetical protein|uniref:hypothetical protein n=1 Tax=Caulobacter sp. S45 TaxID=1641861 RepID=UPI00131BF8D1|nr:hypothetical protein [Caulobacter sp. S45]